MMSYDVAMVCTAVAYGVLTVVIIVSFILDTIQDRRREARHRVHMARYDALMDERYGSADDPTQPGTVDSPATAGTLVVLGECGGAKLSNY